jgi:hypothetical protein
VLWRIDADTHLIPLHAQNLEAYIVTNHDALADTAG